MSERLWFKIGEAAKRVGVSPKELRYWEQLIPEIKPRRSQGNLRYYHLDELPRLQRIKDWLAEGLTVADCRQLLLTGQLTRGLGLGLEEEPEEGLPIPQPPPAPKGRRSHVPLAVAGPGDPIPILPERLRPIVEALRALHGRLGEPAGSVRPRHRVKG